MEVGGKSVLRSSSKRGKQQQQPKDEGGCDIGRKLRPLPLPVGRSRRKKPKSGIIHPPKSFRKPSIPEAKETSSGVSSMGRRRVRSSEKEKEASSSSDLDSDPFSEEELEGDDEDFVPEVEPKIPTTKKRKREDTGSRNTNNKRNKVIKTMKKPRGVSSPASNQHTFVLTKLKEKRSILKGLPKDQGADGTVATTSICDALPG